MELSYITRIEVDEKQHALDQSAQLIVTEKNADQDGGVKLLFPEEYYRYYSVVEIAALVRESEQRRIWELLQAGTDFHWHTQPFRAFWTVGPAFHPQKAAQTFVEAQIQKTVTNLDGSGRTFYLLREMRNNLQKIL